MCVETRCCFVFFYFFFLLCSIVILCVVGVNVRIKLNSEQNSEMYVTALSSLFERFVLFIFITTTTHREIQSSNVDVACYRNYTHTDTHAHSHISDRSFALSHTRRYFQRLHVLIPVFLLYYYLRFAISSYSRTKLHFFLF